MSLGLRGISPAPPPCQMHSKSHRQRILQGTLKPPGPRRVRPPPAPRMKKLPDLTTSSLQTGPHRTRWPVGKWVGADQLTSVMKEFDPVTFYPQDPEASLSVCLSRCPSVRSVWPSVAAVHYCLTDMRVASRTAESHPRGN